MSALLYPIFLLRLALAFTPFATKLFISLYKYFILILGSILLSLSLSFSYLQLNTLISPPLSQTEPQFDTAKIRQQISRLEKQLENQPNHRDILINLSLLYQAIGDQTTANQYQDQAQQLDPNHPFFTKN